MPSDIRSFFGGGGGGGGKPAAKSATTKKDVPAPAKVKPQRGRPRKVVSSSDDDDDIPQTRSKIPATPKTKKAGKEFAEEETTSSAYFASSKAKPAKSTPIRSKITTTPNKVENNTPKQTNGGTPSTGRRSARRTTAKIYAEDSGDEPRKLKDEDEGRDDIFNEMKSRKVDDDYDEGTDDDDDVMPQSRPSKAVNGPSRKPQQHEDESDLDVAQVPSYDGPGDRKVPRSATTSTITRKRKSKDLEDDETNFLDDDDDTPKKKTKKTTTTARKPRAPTKKEEREESKEIQDILDTIPTVRAPTPPPRDDESRKFKFGGGNANAAPPAQGSLEIPVGEENCLAGLTFVFTGVLSSIGREEGQSLVKQYGGKVTGAPSKKTSYVVVGSDAGPKKLETIKAHGIKTINEEGLFALIKRLPANGGDGKAGEAYAEKQAKEEAKIRQQAQEMEERERKKQKDATKAAEKAAMARPNGGPASAKPRPKVDDRLWVDKYAPDSMTSVCGNKSTVEGLQAWLRAWPNNQKSGFRKAGASGRGIFRAALLHGPPGIGKTTAAHLVAKLEGYDVVESNASETRNKKLLETGLKGVLDTTSLLGYFAGDGKKVDASKRKLLLIMDEVDGMSAGDRGGVGAMAAVAKKTNIPIIMICNERRLPKMKPFDGHTAEFAFRRPTTDMIRSRIATICFREGIKLPSQVLNALIEGCNGDIRQIINMISTVKLDKKDIDFNDSKAMSKAWEKHVILKPWDIVNKILRPQMFSASSTATLNDKTELYFNDHEFSFLMLQENYLKTQPTLASSYSGRERNMKLLELYDNAASSISDGDLVDRMIHGSQQQWGLMPTHAIFSFVRPASYIYGNFNVQVGFASWLGQNSKQGRLSGMVKEIQGHMRLRTSADRHEVRQQYLPAIWNKTVNLLNREGKESAQDVIDFMDSYYLTKEDYEAVLELGVGPMDQAKVKLDAATKATFTRLYNQQSHPMPFVKASHVLGTAKGGAKRDKPDLEEAVDESEAEEIVDNANADDNDEIDLKKDKYIRAPKKKPAAAKGKGASKSKRKKDADSEDDDDESEDQPKKKKAAAGATRGGRKGKGRA